MAIFFLMGKLYEEGVSIKAERLWLGVPASLRLNLKIEEASILTLSGTMVGDYVDQADLDWTITDEMPGLTPKTLDQGELVEKGVGGFCCRVFAYPVRPTWVKIAIMVYPLNREELAMQHKLYNNPAFPGIEFKSEEIQFCPLSNDKRWGCPFVPLLLTGGCRGTFPHIPDTDEIRAKVASILRTAVKPDSSRNMAGLQPKWEAISVAGASKLKEKVPDTIWPEIEGSSSAGPQTGRNGNLKIYHSPRIS